MSNVLNDPHSQNNSQLGESSALAVPLHQSGRSQPEIFAQERGFLICTSCLHPWDVSASSSGLSSCGFCYVVSSHAPIEAKRQHSRAFAAWVNFDAAWAETPGMQTGA